MKFASLTDFTPIMPELVLVLFAVLVLLVDLFGPKPSRLNVALISGIGLVVAFFLEFSMFGTTVTGFWDTIVSDSYSTIFELLYITVAFITLCISYPYIEQKRVPPGEYCALLLCSVVGMMFMTSALDLLVIFIGLEIMSISSYILVGCLRDDEQSHEAALKYLLLGAFSSGFLLYGISLIYGATGTIYLPDIILAAQQAGSFNNPILPLGIALMLIGFCFKIAIAPFHMWTPDVYTGAPTPITGFLSAAAKAAGFAVLVRIFLTGLPLHEQPIMELLSIMAVLTMCIGNFLALQQKRIKRMLAYSSIAHAGYVLIAFIAASPEAVSSIIFYSFSYGIMAIGAFGVLSMQRKSQNIDTFDDLSGFASESPVLAGLMSLFMLSMIGLPLTAGFVGKYQIFVVALESGLIGLALIGILNSAVSIYYYLKVIVHMYMKETPISLNLSSDQATIATPYSAITGLGLSGALVVYLGLFPSNFIEMTYVAISSWF